jgi:hypothetical protein
MGALILAPAGVRAQGRPTRSESLYRLISAFPQYDFCLKSLKQFVTGFECKNLFTRSIMHVAVKIAESLHKSSWF